MSYVPTNPPAFADVAQLQAYVESELRLIAQSLAETTVLELRQISAAPSRPREGMIISADGTNWNPGAGAGAYELKGGVWVKL